MDSVKTLFDYFGSRDLRFSKEDALPRERKSLIRLHKIFKNYGNIPKKVVFPASSDEDSDQGENKGTVPSVYEVAKRITDINTIMIVKNPKNFPNEANPSLIIIGLEKWVNDSYVKMFLDDVPSVKGEKLAFRSVKILDWENKKCAWVKMQHFSQCEAIGNFFDHPIKKIFPSKNSLGQTIEVYLAFDLLEVTMSNWYGVILRNLPSKCDTSSISDFCDSYAKGGIKYCLEPAIIKDCNCCILVMNDIENAEKLCIDLNKNKVGINKTMQVNFHPQMCKIRKNHEDDYFRGMFNKYGYIFQDIVLQSGKMVELATPLPNLYPKANKQNNFNNNGKGEEGEIKEEFIPSKAAYEKKEQKKKEAKKNTLKTNDLQIESKSISESMVQNKSLLEFLLPRKYASEKIEVKKNIEKKEEKPQNQKEKETPENQVTQKKNTLSDTMNNLYSGLKSLKQSKEDTKEESSQKKHSEISNGVEHNQSSVPLPTEIKYDKSEISYYTYDMRDQEYYDNKKEKLEKYKTSTLNFQDRLQEKKREIEKDIGRKQYRPERRRHHYDSHHHHRRSSYSRRHRSRSRRRSYSRSSNSSFDDRNYHSKYSMYYDKRNHHKYHK